MQRRRLTASLIALAALMYSAHSLAAERIHSPRFQDRLCPPEYPEAREWIEGFIRVDHMGGRLRSLFGEAAPASISEITLLDDRADAAACSYLATLYDQLINTKVRISEQSDAYYLHDVSFYKGGDFYFVAIGGGVLTGENPHVQGQEVLWGSHVTGVSVYDKTTMEFVDWEWLYDELHPEEK